MHEQNEAYVLHNVSYSYAKNGIKFEALKDINLTIKHGEFVAIVGASGSGKSTLLNLLGMMAPPTQGALSFFGNSVVGLSADTLSQLRNAQLGFIFQQFHLLPKLSVLDNVMLGAYYSASVSLRELKLRAIQLLTEFGLDSQLEKLPTALSGGQKQRVALCRSLLLKPRVILADEPTGALDSKNAALVMKHLQELNSQGHTVIVITHDSNIAAQAGRIVRIKDGKIEFPENHVSQFSVTDVSKVLQETFSKNHSSSSIAVGNKLPLVNRIAQLFHLFWQAMRLSLQNMSANLMRSLLTLLGLSIGILSMVVMVTLSGAMRDTFQNKFKSRGGNGAIVYYDPDPKSGYQIWRGINKNTELKSVNAAIENKGTVEAFRSQLSCHIKSGESNSSQTLSSFSSFQKITEAKLLLAKGRFFTPTEILESDSAKLAILGDSVVKELFPSLEKERTSNPQYPIGEILTAAKCGYGGTLKIVGVLQKNNELAMFESSPNSSIYVPAKMLAKNGLSKYATTLMVTPKEGIQAPALAENVVKLIKLQTNDRFNLSIFSIQEFVEKFNLMLLGLSALTVVIGGICAVTGGVGVMNIMLVNMTERIREIGLRKALGAQGHHIRNMFLIESGVLCLFAGIIGVVFGLAISNIAYFIGEKLIPKLVVYSFLFNVGAVLFALGMSFLAGIFFGLLPAKKAAAMDVVEALRQE